ncbi:DUF58 domain-containing protein [Sporosarcina limicola]|uniref:Uncharacterized protein (DUF58 family) n=1 Tax=Sporosarcina limicola TaxID=34101 RepID=A0A927ML51_9BACL|nr:DUF58 domain-containing protein [Sporosarcina limicola]MBE1556730.1 uncharacterized protein (DUF58 family) [Sporosarcina limicola]
MRQSVKQFGIVGRVLFIVLILASSFIFAMFQGGGVSWTIFYTLLPFSIYSVALFLYPMSDLSVIRTICTPDVENGGKLIVSLSVRRQSRFPLLYTVVTEKWEEQEIPLLAGEQLKRLFIFGLRKEMKWEYEIERMPRGEHVLQGVEVEVSDFFGWLRKTKFIEQSHTIVVFPKITDIHYVPIDTQYDRGAMASPLNIVKDTTMATGVRDYQAGDRVTWIHWKSFARTQNLMTKEFEDKRSQELFLILDGRKTEMFEEQLELVASTLKEAAGHQVGLAFLTTGSEPTLFPFIQSDEQLHHALVHLAKIKPIEEGMADSVMDFGTAIQHGGSIVLITGNPDKLFIQSLLRNVGNVKSIICFIVVKQDEVMPETMENNIRQAKSKGIIVHILGRKQFAQAFKEVARL